MTRRFPLYTSHDDVSCFNCGGDFGPDPYWRQVNFPEGRYALACCKCGMVTFYDLCCSDCGWPLPRFGCPHKGCNGVALHTRKPVTPP